MTALGQRPLGWESRFSSRGLPHGSPLAPCFFFFSPSPSTRHSQQAPPPQTPRRFLWLSACQGAFVLLHRCVACALTFAFALPPRLRPASAPSAPSRDAVSLATATLFTTDDLWQPAGRRNLAASPSGAPTGVAPRRHTGWPSKQFTHPSKPPPNSSTSTSTALAWRTDSTARPQTSYKRTRYSRNADPPRLPPLRGHGCNLVRHSRRHAPRLAP